MTNVLLRVVVLGYLVRGPLGGLAWHHLQYVVGLARLGCDVWFLEDSDDHPWSCYDPTRHLTDTDPTYGLRFADGVFERLGLGDRWAYYDAHTASWHGPASARIVDVCAEAELLVNLGGVNPLRPWVAGIPHRALIDTDPVFTQLKILENAVDRERAEQHTVFFTYAENVGRTAALPDDGHDWRPTRQPVVLDLWPVSPAPADGCFTTVMQWESYPAREHEGVRYGLKADSFDPYLGLPRRVGARMELALGGPGAPHALLREHGWRTRNPLETAPDPWAYQRYIQRSRGEFTVAKHGYVVSRSGWFSERSAGYLASGRPVVTQETGFSDWLPSGTGVLAFSTLEEAVAAIEDVGARYRRHSAAARALAEEWFDSAAVLTRLIEDALAPLGASRA